MPRHRIVLGALLTLGLASAAGAVAAARIEAGAGVLKVRMGGDVRRTRVVIELEKAASGRLLSGDAANAQVALALAHASAVDGMGAEGSGLVRRWKVENALGEARLKLDLVRPAVVTHRFLLPPADGVEVFRYVIDLESGDAAPVTRASRPARPIELAPAAPDAPKVVVIDAGHGGKDPGSRGDGVVEKTVTLAAAKALRAELQRTGRYHVVLTRETDVFVPLEARVRIARRANADLFLSLHADSGTEPGLKGVSAYTLSDKGGDRVSRQVFGGRDYFIDVDLPGGDPTVKQILLDLTQRETRNQSAAFADLLLERVGRATPLLRRSHRDAGFVVLFAPDVPAVLMEMGFLTNPDDAASLGSPARRRKVMAEAARAIDEHFAAGRTVAMN